MDNVELSRRLENLLRIGRIAAVDHAHALCRVDTGGLTTDWLPWFERRAGTTRTWDPPTVGEQAMIFSPSGEPAGGIVLCGIFQDAHGAPDDSPNTHVIDYPDGARISYNHVQHTLLHDVPAGGSITLRIGQTRLIMTNAGTTLDTPALDIVQAS